MCNNTISATTSVVLELTFNHALPSTSPTSVSRYQESLCSDITTLLSDISTLDLPSITVTDIYTDIQAPVSTYTPLTTPSQNGYTSMSSVVSASVAAQPVPQQTSRPATPGYTRLRS